MVKKWFTIVLLLLPMITLQAQDNILTDAETGTQYIIEEYVAANFPVGMAFAPDGRLFYNEKITGNVRVVLPDGTLQVEPVVYLETDALQERGMLGIAISPDFENDNTLYVVHTAAGDARNFPANRLVRFVIDENNIAGEVEELLRYPIETGELLHNGGNVHFDSEGFLYLSLGDFGDATNAQNIDTPQGAIHRFELVDGELTIPDDNPFEDNSIFSFGFRNPFDFAFDTMSDVIFVAEVGPSCDDEINATRAGYNHGWIDNYECVGTDGIVDVEDYVPPMLSYEPVISPTGIVVYEGDAFPEWEGDLFFCDWNYGNLRRVELDETRTQVEAVHEIDSGDTTCKLDLLIGPEGGLYFGTVGGGGGVIMRLLPAEQ